MGDAVVVTVATPSALPDLAARVAALTAIDRSWLVEAGAGSGKTSIMAGRVVVLLARGVEPKHVAAITFTEFAASELQIRVDRFVREFAEGNVPSELEFAFSDGISPAQRENLARARATLDQLTCSTIHGFAQALIKPYPVEADIDPGAAIIDPAEADLAFAERLEAWLKAELSGGERQEDVVAQLVLASEVDGLKLVREVAAFRRANRNARPADNPWAAGRVATLTGAVRTFRLELDRIGFREATTDGCLEAFASLDTALGTLDLARGDPSTGALIALVQLARPAVCFNQNGLRKQLQTKGRWATTAHANRASKADGERACETATRCYEDCHRAYAALVAAAAGEVLVRLSSSMDTLMSEWRNYKRTAALLDFDDLLYTARDLLAQHEAVRHALAQRYRHVLVDEFQDTDPLQTEILWRLCGKANAEGAVAPLARSLREGALFLVGDPKQAIYRFRGADVHAYVAARESIGAPALLEITANFRSVKPILDFVNARFAQPLSPAAGQPGFTALAPTRDGADKTLAVAALDVPTNADQPATMLRDTEATCVAALCRRLIGGIAVTDPETRATRPCQAGDIALLAPVGTDLWRFEEALEAQGIAVSTQAGKGFFWRQEVQDLIALTRSLADSRDTLALGALLRGPLVGLSETELLDIAHALPVNPDRPDRLQSLRLWAAPEQIDHALARNVLQALQQLARRARFTTPFVLLSDAVEALAVRPQLRQRFGTGAERALANVDLFLEMARAYEVRGLRAFALDMRANWEEAVRQVEGRPDAQQQAVALITIHAAKGLEWPIVIPINMTGTPRDEGGIVYDRQRAQFSAKVLRTEPSGYATVKAASDQEQERERVRLWYVASTRARDFLILPRHAAALPARSWAQLVDLELPSLPAFDVVGALPSTPVAGDEPANAQTAEIFAAEAERIIKATRKLTWQSPSLAEAGAQALGETPAIFRAPENVEAVEATPMLEVVGSATRGTILHKLMEEVLTGETAEDIASLTARADELLSQLWADRAAASTRAIAPAELAATVERTLQLPPIAALRSRLLPECRVYGCAASGNEETLISGIADALALRPDATIDVVIDWKSDVDPDSTSLARYGEQLATYRAATGATRALLVLMTTGKVVELV